MCLLEMYETIKSMLIFPDTEIAYSYLLSIYPIRILFFFSFTLLICIVDIVMHYHVFLCFFELYNIQYFVLTKKIRMIDFENDL